MHNLRIECIDAFAIDRNQINQIFKNNNNEKINYEKKNDCKTAKNNRRHKSLTAHGKHKSKTAVRITVTCSMFLFFFTLNFDFAFRRYISTIYICIYNGLRTKCEQSIQIHDLCKYDLELNKHHTIACAIIDKLSNSIRKPAIYLAEQSSV